MGLPRVDCPERGGGTVCLAAGSRLEPAKLRDLRGILLVSTNLMEPSASITAASAPKEQPKAQSLRQRLGTTAAGEITGAACLWLAQVLVARLGGVSMLGAFGLGFAIATPVILFSNLHLRPVYVVDETSSWEFEDYLGLRLVSLLVATVVGSCATVGLGLDWEVASVVLAVMLYRIAEALGDIFIAPAQRRNQLGRYGVSRGARGALLLMGILGGKWMGFSVTASIWLGCSFTLLLSTLYDRETARRYATARPRISWTHMTSLARWTAPAGIAAALLSLTLGIPAYVLEAVREVREVGFLTAALSIVAIGSMLNVIVGGATIRNLARMYARGDRSHLRFLARLCVGIAGLHGVLVLMVVFAGDLYLTKVYAADYAHLHDALIWVSVTGLIAGVGNIMSQTVMAMRRFRTQLAVNTVGVIAVVVAAFALLPTYGVLGAVFIHLGVAIYRLLVFFVVLVVPASLEETGSHQPSASSIQK